MSFFKKKLSNLHVFVIIAIVAGGTFFTTGLVSYLIHDGTIPGVNKPESHFLEIPEGNKLYNTESGIIGNTYIAIYDPNGSGGVIFYDVKVSETEFLNYMNLTLADVSMRNGTKKIIIENNTFFEGFLNIAYYDVDEQIWYVRKHPTVITLFPWLLDEVIKKTI